MSDLEIDIIIKHQHSNLYMEQTTWNLIRNAILRVYYNLTFLFLKNFHSMQFWMFHYQHFSWIFQKILLTIALLLDAGCNVILRVALLLCYSDGWNQV